MLQAAASQRTLVFPTSPVVPAVAQLSGFLAYAVVSEKHGVEIRRVEEIRVYESVTPIANAPDFIKGVINLRRVIIPSADRRIKFDFVFDKIRLNMVKLAAEFN